VLYWWGRCVESFFFTWDRMLALRGELLRGDWGEGATRMVEGKGDRRVVEDMC